eukprot:1603981-Lingulodinium_polyedra.AAC.1
MAIAAGLNGERGLDNARPAISGPAPGGRQHRHRQWMADRLRSKQSHCPLQPWQCDMDRSHQTRVN